MRRILLPLAWALSFGLAACGGIESAQDAGESTVDGGAGDAGAGCEASNTINDITFAIECTGDGRCRCLLDGEQIAVCQDDDPTCSTEIDGNTLTVGCCEFGPPG